MVQGISPKLRWLQLISNHNGSMAEALYTHGSASLDAHSHFRYGWISNQNTHRETYMTVSRPHLRPAKIKCQRSSGKVMGRLWGDTDTDLDVDLDAWILLPSPGVYIWWNPASSISMPVSVSSIPYPAPASRHPNLLTNGKFKCPIYLFIKQPNMKKSWRVYRWCCDRVILLRFLGSSQSGG